MATTIFAIAQNLAAQNQLTENKAILEKFPSPPYETPVIESYKTMIEALLAESADEWNSATKMWEHALEISGLEFFDPR